MKTMVMTMAMMVGMGRQCGGRRRSCLRRRRRRRRLDRRRLRRRMRRRLCDPFPAVNPKNFTAASPTTAEVNAFLKQAWGYDENRIWSVAAILKTPAPGVARVVVFVADKTQPDKGTRTTSLRRRMASTRLRAA